MNKETLKNIFQEFNNLKVLIIGDVMIDAYLWGDVNRISPEAPVPIVVVNKRENRLGGAANVALNIQAMGAKPILCSIIGEDEKSKLFLELLEKQNITSKGILKNSERVTTVKTRIIGNNHQMLRVDSENENENSPAATAALFELIKSLLNEEKIDVIIFEDYDKGVITADLIKQIVSLALEKGIPVAADPKKRNFMAYHGVTLLKPNIKELKEGLKIDFNPNLKDELVLAVTKLREQLDLKFALVTLSEKGILAATDMENTVIPAHVRNIADVSGAGDTVISVAALCLALKLPALTLASLANLAGGLVCEYVGVVSVNKEHLYQEALQFGNINS
ncbi:MAG: D-glycero-beta-D-manno-heptose-7-phosphate kinase [Bacteroidetes bacterium]|nr:D-glycero-beta-D-manno-heptose-7-phosphate kinase [Bacteroidota bacterium]HET6242997.1 bifunctional ADP-heptose synthase [Bacteroidia bacterium]